MNIPEKKQVHLYVRPIKITFDRTIKQLNVRKILLIAFAIVSPMLFAQLPQSLLVETTKVDSFDENYYGSIYKEAKPKKSIVVHEKSGTYESSLRYNAYTDAIEFEKDSSLFHILKSEPVHVKIDDEYYYYCEFKTQRNRPRDGYYILVDQAQNYRIYKKYTVDIKEPTEQEAVSTGGATPGAIRMVTTYYLEENNIIVELPLRKKEMLAMFESNQSALNSFFKREKIKLKKEDDLIKFVSHFNALSQTSRQRSLLSSINPR